MSIDQFQTTAILSSLEKLYGLQITFNDGRKSETGNPRIEVKDEKGLYYEVEFNMKDKDGYFKLF